MPKVFAEKSSGKKSHNVAQNMKEHKIPGPSSKHQVARVATHALNSRQSLRLGLAERSMLSFTVPLVGVQRKPADLVASHLPLAYALRHADAIRAFEADEAMKSEISRAKGSGERVHTDKADGMNLQIGAKIFVNRKDKPDIVKNGKRVIAHELLPSWQQIGFIHESGNAGVVQRKGPFFNNLSPEIVDWLKLNQCANFLNSVNKYVALPNDDDYSNQLNKLRDIRMYFVEIYLQIAEDKKIAEDKAGPEDNFYLILKDEWKYVKSQYHNENRLIRERKNQKNCSCWIV
jgi:hypothetical protein